MTSFEAGRRVPAWLWMWLPGCVLGAGVWWALQPSAAPIAKTPVSMHVAPGSAAPAAVRPTLAARAPALAGVDVPPGPETDARGNLLLTRALRTYFDHFDSAGADDAIDDIVRDDIRTHVPDSAGLQAFALWRRYRDYLRALRTMADHRAQVAVTTEVAPAQVATLRAQRDARRALRQQYLADVSAAWFGEDDAYDDVMLERMEVAAQPGLDAAERRRRLDAAESRLPASMRDARAAGERPHQISETIEAMQAQGRGAQDIAAALAQAYGADVGQRYAQQAQADQAWKDRYADYARQRQQIEQFAGLSDTDRQQQIEQLRQRVFPDASDGLRAYATDTAGR